MADPKPMPTPIAAELLVDHEGADQDERGEGVYLIDVDEDGELKTTAQRVRGGWRISDWELTEELEGALGGARYWFCRSFFTVPDDQLRRILGITQAQKIEGYKVGDSLFESESEAVEEIRTWGPSNATAAPLYAWPVLDDTAEQAIQLLHETLELDLPEELRARIGACLGIEPAASYTDDLPF